MSTDVEALIREGRIERVEADVDAARDRLEEARHHLDSAGLIAETDPAGAYSLRYASTALGSGPHGGSARRFDRMRRNRNRSEYGAWQIGRSTLEADLGHARRIVEAVEESLA